MALKKTIIYPKETSYGRVVSVLKKSLCFNAEWHEKVCFECCSFFYIVNIINHSLKVRK